MSIKIYNLIVVKYINIIRELREPRLFYVLFRVANNRISSRLVYSFVSTLLHFFDSSCI